MERQRFAVEPVQIANQRLDARVTVLLKQMPIERMVVIPFPRLREFAAHEQKLLARMAEHEAVIGAQVCKTLPVVAGHAPEDRTLAVNDFVMRQRQDEVFRKRIMQAKQDIAVM